MNVFSVESLRIFHVPSWIVVATLALVNAASAAPPDRCDPWPQCKDGGGGEEDPPTGSTCNDVFIDPDPDNPNRTCWLLGEPGSECPVSQSKDRGSDGWFFTDDCQTSCHNGFSVVVEHAQQKCELSPTHWTAP